MTLLPWEEVPSVFDMLGGISRKGDIWELNSLSENQHPHRWIPEMFEFITLVYNASHE